MVNASCLTCSGTGEKKKKNQQHCNPLAAVFKLKRTEKMFKSFWNTPRSPSFPRQLGKPAQKHKEGTLWSLGVCPNISKKWQLFPFPVFYSKSKLKKQRLFLTWSLKVTPIRLHRFKTQSHICLLIWDYCYCLYVFISFLRKKKLSPHILKHETKNAQVSF